MIILKEVPIIPAQIPNKKYKIPISLWFVENNHFLMDIINLILIY